ncbi:hypothetical protein ACFLQW_00160 [Candidatus Zixiibacteriota bacterium]
MAKPTKGKAKGRNRRRGKAVKSSGAAAGFGAFADVMTAIIERIGWPGGVFLLGYHFVVQNASSAQKTEIVDLYVLGKGLGAIYPIILMVATFAVVIIGQHLVYKKKLKVKTDEIDRLSKWKSEHQQNLIKGPLHHTD